MSLDAARRSRVLRSDVFVLVVVLAGLLYTLLAWTPSSYGVALGAIGAPGEGLVLGTPRPIRSDEWAVWTPYVQAAVENGFERYNARSPFGEDLRNFNGLPLKDWALPFKPQFWLFFVADPAWAFSFSHAIFIVLFLVGYHRLLIAFGFPKGWSATGSLLLFFTSYAQFWWTTTGPLLAVFPWLLLAASTPMAWWLRFAAVAYLTVFWLLSHLYPPVVAPLGFAGAVLLAAFRPEALRPKVLLPALAGAAVGVGLTWLYLEEPIRVMASTVFPGARSLGGGGVSTAQYLAQFFPFLVSADNHVDLLGLNICEVATGGSYLMVLSLIFLDHGRLGSLLRTGGEERTALLRQLGLPLAGFALMSVWMLVSLPDVYGKPLLWNKVLGQRMVFAAGLLLHVSAFTLMRAASVKLSWERFALAALAVVAAWLAAKGGLDNLRRLDRNLSDVAVLVPLAAAVWLAVRRPETTAGPRAALALALCALLANAAGFGRLNPIQSAAPIFHPPRTAATERFDALAAAHPEGWVAAEGLLPGGVMQGLGYASPQHVLIAPALGFFRPYFPDMDAAAFNEVFNRYAHVHLVSGLTAPRVRQADVIEVPLERFQGPRPASAKTVPTAGIEK